MTKDALVERPKLPLPEVADILLPPIPDPVNADQDRTQQREAKVGLARGVSYHCAARVCAYGNANKMNEVT